jgi:hypothetical protein
LSRAERLDHDGRRTSRDRRSAGLGSFVQLDRPMYNAMIIYRPSPAAIATNTAAKRPALPKEIHVHATGLTVAVDAAGATRNFPTVYEMYSHFGLVAADLVQVA